MSKRRQTALQAVQALNDWDIEAIMSYRHESCIHEMLPKSLERPPADNATFRKHFSALMPLLKNYKAEVEDLVEDAASNKVAVHIRGSADSDFEPYRNEFISKWRR
ncbi:hypothetical protein PFICI_05839 [Pestalotiopsis fici W106-1]|uniref:Uncharacterized protein n=1 Tax=Pestalotiopsis fici (strain W106-1 / CGMCC3.15140) TaxID=1229662 RepID=W3XCY7_PESFW|nr:uncharacterized protein PFICI_05839 [Pestalotiopsis fici W106-1]ETS83963.1 hypothetical protein PFICI_05839 [Pestalotiopsis fici W106-1]